MLIADGERAKTAATIAHLHSRLLEWKADRATTIVVVGGGVVGDAAGFAAATWLRGLPLVQVPTTLVAQIDSAIGGKVGVNHPRGKNLIGAFHPPVAVVVDPQLLETLPRRELRAGLYEAIKYGVIANRTLFGRLASRLTGITAGRLDELVPVITACCRIKARIVEQDERERDRRRLLNFGHTVGHALEAVTRYARFRHGEAVGYGMQVAVEVAAARGLLTPAEREAVLQAIEGVGTRPTLQGLRASEIVAATALDKKTVGGRRHFVLPQGIGRATVVDDVTDAELKDGLRRLGVR